MILFLDDWKKYPNAIMDVATSNQSFVRMAALYKKIGIQNHGFMLALINKDLIGLDPFSPHLTLEQKLAITLECKMNPWYYFREVAKAPSKTGNELVQFEANRGNIATLWLFFNHVTLTLIQIRQTGKSFTVDSLSTYLLNVRCTNTQINLLTKDDSLRAANIRRLKDIDSELPVYMRQRTKSDANNLEELTIRSLGNSFLAHVPQKSPKAALNVGRGLTSPIFVIDEGPFQPNIGISLPAALAAGTAARDSARKNGEPYGTILTTTVGKRDDRDGKFIYNLVVNSAEWTERFLDSINLEELEKAVRRNSPTGQLRVNCTFNHTQLGKSDAWLKKAIEETINSDEEAINRDFFNMWSVGTMSSPLPLHILEKIRKSEELELYTKIDSPYGYITKWFIPEELIERRMQISHYVLGMDTSDASGGDDISFFILDIRNAETIAVGTFNETNLITFAQWLCTWFVTYENITCIIERRSSGVAILDYLLLMLPTMGIDPFKRLFNTCVNNHIENPDRWKEINLPLGRRRHDSYVVHKKTFGFTTSGSGMTSRTELYSTTLQMAAKTGGHKIKHKTTINQVTGLITLNGRVDHAPGEHDDMVIAWLLCFWLITKGQNLSYYGIDSRQILSEVEIKEIVNARQASEYREQQELRSSIEELIEQLGNERDEYVIQRLEFKLRGLNRRLVLEDGEKFSLDELINSLRDKRKTSRYTDKSNDSRFTALQRQTNTIANQNREVRNIYNY